MRWFKRSSADTPHLKSLSPLNSNELQQQQQHQQQGSLHPVVSNGTIAAATVKSGEVGSRNEFLSAAMVRTTAGIEEEQRQYAADAMKRNDSDRYSGSKENRRDWRRSYNRNTINCYNIQEGKIVNSVKIRDRSLSPSFLRRKRSDIMDVRKIFETTKTKETNELNSQDYHNMNTVRIKFRNNLAKERRNPLPTTRLSFCESKLAFEDASSCANYEHSPLQPHHDVNSLSLRINEMLNTSAVNKGRFYPTSQMYYNEGNINKTTKSNSLGNKSKSVEDFSKDDVLSLNRLNKPENKFKTLSGKTQKFLSNFYRTHFDKPAKQPSTQNLYCDQQQPQMHQHQHKNRSYETNNRFITDPVIPDDMLNNEWCHATDYRLSDSCYSTLVDSHLMTASTDADSGILENDSGQSSLNSIPVGENSSTDAGVRHHDASGNMINHSSNGESRLLGNTDFLVTILCDDSFRDFSKHLYHSKGSYFITNIIVKKMRVIDGFILAGDEILDICGIPIRGKAYIEIYNLLQNIQLNAQNNCVRLLLRRISEVANGNASSSLANTYQKGVAQSRRSGICLLRDLEKSPDKSLDYAANAIRIDGSRTKLKPPTETISCQRKTINSGYGSITRRLIRRSVLGKLTSSSVIDVSQTDTLSIASDQNNGFAGSSNSDNESANTEIEQHGSVSTNFFTLPRKSKIGVYSFHTICYEKGPGKKSLGFTIVGGRDSPKGAIGIFVKRILNTGQAIDDGRLRVGDEILSVNGQVCHDLSHEEAVKLFKSIRNGEIVLRVCRREKQTQPDIINNNEVLSNSSRNT